MKKFFNVLLFSAVSLVCYSQTGPGGVGTTDGTSNLYLWLDADKIEGVIENNNISTWYDASGYGNNALGTSNSSKPNLYKNYVNGFPTVRFNGGEFLQGTFESNLGAPVSVFTVCYFDSLNQDTLDDAFIFSVGSQTGNNASFSVARNSRSGANSNRFLNEDGLFTNFGTALTGQVWTAIKFIQNTGSPFTELLVDGVSQSIDNNMSQAFSGNQDFKVGHWSQNTNPTYMMDGKIPEVILYKAILNTAETNIVNSYLAAKYNLTITGDKYTGDDGANDDNDRNVIGIGIEADGSHSESTAGGLGIKINSNFDNGDYFVAGHPKTVSDTVNTNDTATGVGGIEARWERVWWGDVTNTSTDISVDFTFNLDDANLGTTFLAPASNYKLLYRASNSGNWTVMATASSMDFHNVYFNNITITNDGYYTIGTVDISMSPLGIIPVDGSCKGPGGIGETDGTSDLKLWLNAEALNGGDNDPLVNFYDFSGNNSHATDLDVVNIPVIKTNVVNGMDAISFDGNDYIEGDLSSALAAPATIISVGYFNNDQGANDNDYLISIGDPSAANRHCSIGRRKNDGSPASDSNKYYSWTGTATVFGPVITKQTWNVFYQEQTTSGNFHNLYIDGASQSVSANPSAFSATSTKYRVGEWQNKNFTGLNGYVAETIVFDRQLNSAERNILNSYLGAKYDLTITDDKYTGDDGANDDNDLYVAGIGKESDGSNLCASSAGIMVTQNSGFDDGDYLMLGISKDTNGVNASDIAVSGGTIEARWERVWWADVTDPNTSMSVDVMFDYSDANLSGDIFPDGVANDYKLIYRATNSGSWTILDSGDSVYGDQVMFTGVSFPADGYYTLASVDSLINPLPVELLTFNAHLNKQEDAVIEWKTASEFDNDYFIVQKSNDINDWEDIEKVKGLAHSVSIVDYQVVDKAPYAGVTYYRLKQVDFDGTVTYSKVRVVELDKGFKIIKSYPNPGEGDVTIKVIANRAEPIEILVYDILGKVVLSKTVMLKEGHNELSINVSSMPANTYLLRVVSSDGTYNDQLKIQVKEHK